MLDSVILDCMISIYKGREVKDKKTFIDTAREIAGRFIKEEELDNPQFLNTLINKVPAKLVDIITCDENRDILFDLSGDSIRELHLITREAARNSFKILEDGIGEICSQNRKSPASFKVSWILAN